MASRPRSWRSVATAGLLAACVWPGLSGCRSSCFAKRDHQDPVRAGFPDEVSSHAAPSDTGRYYGYQGGGGSWSWRKGDQPRPEEGTWGWDYGGWKFPSFNALGWWHGRRYQGGEGAYKVEEPGLFEKAKIKQERKELPD